MSSLDQNFELEQQKLVSLEKEVLKKEQILKNHNLPSNLKPSYILNNIVKEIPATVLLSELILNPIAKKGKDGNISEFNKNILILSGKTTDNENLLVWTRTLEHVITSYSIHYTKLYDFRFFTTIFVTTASH